MRPLTVTRPTFDSEGFLKAWREGKAAQRQEALNRLTPQKVKALAEQAPGLLTAETNPGVALSLIGVFADAWPKSQLKPLFERLGARQVSLRTAALETLNRLAPETLIKSLPELLQARNPRIRVLAIQGLANIDPTEAVRHIEHLLLRGTPAQKRIGLQCTIFLPFLRIRDLLLRMVATEADRELLLKAGAILQVNPDPEIPFRLSEIAEMAARERAETAEQIRAKVLRSLERSGLPDETFSVYHARLQEWINRRAPLRALREIAVRFVAGDPMDIAAVTDRLNPFQTRPEFPEAVNQAMTWPVPGAFRALIREVLKATGNPPTEGFAEAGTGTTLETRWAVDLPATDKVRILSRLQPENTGRFRPILTRVLSGKSEKPAVRIAALRAAQNLGLSEFIDIATALAAQEKDVGLAFAALEYLAALKPGSATARLLHHVRRGTRRQRTAAFRVLSRYFPEKALETILELLDAPDAPSHEAALSGASLIDFSLLRDGLTFFLERHPDSSLFPQCLFLFHSNPEFGNLYSLFKIERFAPAGLLEKVVEVRRHTEQFLITYGRLKASLLPEFEIEFTQMWEQEQERAAHPPDYALETIRPDRP